jgi:hypothetical protein
LSRNTGVAENPTLAKPALLLLDVHIDKSRPVDEYTKLTYSVGNNDIERLCRVEETLADRPGR